MADGPEQPAMKTEKPVQQAEVAVTVAQTPEQITSQEMQRYVEGSEEIREALEVTTDADEWKEFMRSFVVQLPRNPTASGLEGDARQRLMRRYRDLIAMRGSVATSMLYCIRYIQTPDGPLKKRVREQYVTQRDEALRNLALYLVELNEYESLWEGRDMPATTVKIPDFLAGYVLPDVEVLPAYKTAQLMLQMQYDVTEQAGITESPRILYPVTNEVLTRAVQYQVRMKYVLPCLDNGRVNDNAETVNEFLRKIGYEDETITDAERNAARILIGYLGKSIHSIEEFAALEEKGDTGEVTMQDALACSAHLRILGEVAAGMKDQILSAAKERRSINFTQTAQEGAGETSVFATQQLQVMLQPAYQLPAAPTEEQKAQFRTDVTELTQFFHGLIGKGTRTKHVSSAIGSRNPKQKAMAEYIVVESRKPQTARAALQSLGISPEASGQTNEDDQEIASVLSALIENGELSMADAYDLFSPTHVGKGGGIALMVKTLQILDAYGHPKLKAVIEARFAGKIADAALQKGVAGIDEILESMNLTEEQRREMRNLMLFVQEGSVDVVQEEILNLWTWARTNPKYVAIIMAIFVAPYASQLAARTGFRGYIKIKTRDLRVFADLQGNDLTEFCNKYQVKIDDVKRLQYEVDQRLARIPQAHFYYFPLGKTRRMRTEATAFMNAARQAEINAAVGVMRPVFPDSTDIVDVIIDLTDGNLEMCRTALEANHYPPESVERAMKLAEATPFARIFKLEQELVQLRAQAQGAPGDSTLQARIDLLEARLVELDQQMALLTPPETPNVDPNNPAHDPRQASKVVGGGSRQTPGAAIAEGGEIDIDSRTGQSDPNADEEVRMRRRRAGRR